MSNVMTFRLSETGSMSLIEGCTKSSNFFTINSRRQHHNMESSKLSDKLNNNKLYSFAPIPLVIATASATVGGTSVGIFWDAFMNYIFPYMMDIAKVFCAIKIAQAFYQEKRGGRDEGSGVGAFVTYGKWYILFALMPWCVELLDQLGTKMLIDLRGNGLN